MTWLSPAFPVGAFAYSHGLEWAFEAGDLPDAAHLEGWLDDLARHGAGRSDAVLLAEAWRAVSAGDDARLRTVAELSLALSGGRERRLESTGQGQAFLRAIDAAWPCEATVRLRAVWSDPVAYPVALGTAAAGHGLPLRATLEAALLAWLANLVSAAVRLGAVGQSEGQRLTAGFARRVPALSAQSAAATLDDLGTCAFRSDIASLAHETQYSRLFRS
jgi:urease accessory protein